MSTPKLRPFETHGFCSEGETGDQVFGNCLFCDHENHFFVSSKTGQWDCKSCGESGNIYTFLEKIVSHRREKTTKKQYKELSKERGIPVSVLRDDFGLAFDADRERWLIPCFSSTGRVHDIRHWTKKQGMRSTAGCKSQLLGAEKLIKFTSPESRVYICEGEWDAMILSWALRFKPMLDWSVVSVPGAGVLKNEWLPAFKGHKVLLCYDNDQAGENGRDKAREKLKPYASQIEAIIWPKGTAQKYDVRDFIISKGTKSGKKILKALESFSERQAEVTSGEDEYEEIAPVYSVGSVDNPPTFKHVLLVFEKWLVMSDHMRDAIWVCLAHAISPSIGRGHNDQIWLYLVGPAGSGKTVILTSMQGSERCKFESDMSPKSLVSGFQSSHGDPSLLPTWKNKCVVLKDFTEILAKHPTAKDELFGTLRGAYDGEVTRAWGNGVKRHYVNLNFSLLAGVTPKIRSESQASMGERFLRFEIPAKWDQEKEIDEAIENIETGSEMKRELADVVGRFLSREVGRTPEIPQAIKTKIRNLAQLVGILRTEVIRDSYGGKEPKYMPEPEMGTRLGKQLARLAICLAAVQNLKTVNERVFSLVSRVGFDTAKSDTSDVVLALKIGEKALRSDLQARTRLHSVTLYRILEDLKMIGILQSTPGKPEGTGHPPYFWSHSPIFAKKLKSVKVPENKRFTHKIKSE